MIGVCCVVHVCACRRKWQGKGLGFAGPHTMARYGDRLRLCAHFAAWASVTVCTVNST